MESGEKEALGVRLSGMDEGLVNQVREITGRRGAWSCSGFKKTTLGDVSCTVGAGSFGQGPDGGLGQARTVDSRGLKGGGGEVWPYALEKELTVTGAQGTGNLGVRGPRVAEPEEEKLKILASLPALLPL